MEDAQEKALLWQNRDVPLVNIKTIRIAQFINQFVNNRTIQNNYHKIDQVPDQILLSEVISKELKRLGFKFVGPKVIYSHMQATGLVNDHIKSCFRYRELKR